MRNTLPVAPVQRFVRQRRPSTGIRWYSRTVKVNKVFRFVGTAFPTVREHNANRATLRQVLARHGEQNVVTGRQAVERTNVATRNNRVTPLTHYIPEQSSVTVGFRQDSVHVNDNGPTRVVSQAQPNSVFDLTTVHRGYLSLMIEG